MSVELLYTSAPQGLKQGSRGFCTVISTTGMPMNLATRLESLSAYRHAFPPNSAEASKNPVCFSHLKMSVGGQRLSVLSRIADYGVDYSQRTNKIAHHVVVQPEETVAAGPAWLMLNGGVMRTRWDGQCATPPSGPQLPSIQVDSAICHLWKSLTGDAAWGGVVAEAMSQVGGKPTWIVFDFAQSQQLLGMIQEACALLPLNDRWNATFSTYATNVPPDVDCKLRCVLMGTDDARLALARGMVIDLTKSLGVPPATRFTEASRHGVVHRAASEIATSLPALQQADETNVNASHADSTIALPDEPSRKAGDSVRRVPAPPSVTPPAISSALKQVRPVSPSNTLQGSRLKWIALAASLAATLLVAISGAMLLLSNFTKVAISKPTVVAVDRNLRETAHADKAKVGEDSDLNASGEGNAETDADSQDAKGSTQENKSQSNLEGTMKQEDYGKQKVVEDSDPNASGEGSNETDAKSVNKNVADSTKDSRRPMAADEGRRESEKKLQGDDNSVGETRQGIVEQKGTNDGEEPNEKQSYKITAKVDLNRLQKEGKYVSQVEVEMELDKSWAITIYDRDSGGRVGPKKRLENIGSSDRNGPIVSLSAYFDNPQHLRISLEPPDDELQGTGSQIKEHYETLLEACSRWNNPANPGIFTLPQSEVISLSHIATSSDQRELDLLSLCTKIAHSINDNTKKLERLEAFLKSVPANIRTFNAYKKPVLERQQLLKQIEAELEVVSGRIESIRKPREFDFTGVLKLTRNEQEQVLPLKFSSSIQE